MAITLKFAGKCQRCGGWMNAGETANWERGAGVAHVGECPERKPEPSKAPTVGVGVYRKDGKVYVVKPNREKTAHYAKEIVEINGQRISEAGERIEFETVYRAGMIYKLTEADRWPFNEAREFLARYSRCIVCGRTLKAADSIEAGIGPICAQYFG